MDADFARLGFENVVSVSAEHGRGMGQLVEEVERLLPEEKQEQEPQEQAVAVAIVGRPNVGKSSLINAIMQDRRTLVSDVSGTTRDAVDIPYVRKDQHFVLIDTAGIRPRGKHSSSVEVFSVMRSERSIRRADICVLVIDAAEGVTAQDKKIAGLIQEAEKPCVVVLNKWDQFAPGQEERKEVEQGKIAEIQAELFFLDYAPVIPLSAKTGLNMSRLFKIIDDLPHEAAQRIGTGMLNRLLQQAFESQPPPSRMGRRFKILYATQVETRGRLTPPTFLLFVNDRRLLTPPFQKYLESTLRKVERFRGMPVLFRFRSRSEGKERAKKKG